MARIVDITEKLSFDKPQIRIGDTIITVNDEAMTMLEIMPLLEGDMKKDTIIRVCRTLFSEEDFEKIQALKLNIKAFETLFETAMRLVTNGEDAGEAPTHTTT